MPGALFLRRWTPEMDLQPMGQQCLAVQAIRNPGNWRVESGCRSQETRKWSLEVRNWNLEPRSWSLECPDPGGRSKTKPRSRALGKVARGTGGPSILIDKRAGKPAGRE